MTEIKLTPTQKSLLQNFTEVDSMTLHELQELHGSSPTRTLNTLDGMGVVDVYTVVQLTQKGIDLVDRTPGSLDPETPSVAEESEEVKKAEEEKPAKKPNSGDFVPPYSDEDFEGDLPKKAFKKMKKANKRALKAYMKEKSE